MIQEILTRAHELYATAGQKHCLTLNMVDDGYPLVLSLFIGDHWQDVRLTEDELQKGSALMDEVYRTLSGTTVCTKPPKGWRCTRETGHDGPCAAIRTP